MPTIMHETTISPVGGQGKLNKKGKAIPLAGKLQISNAKLIPAIGRKCKVTIEYEDTLPEDKVVGATIALLAPPNIFSMNSGKYDKPRQTP
jgi:hypothetical protein